MEFISEIKPEKTNVTPRYRCKNWFLTFPRCDTAKEVVLENLKKCDKVKILGVVIAQETHEDKGLHLHVALWLQKLACLPCDYWDRLTGKHGNYSKMRNQLAAYKYCYKDDPQPLEYGTIAVSNLVKNTQTIVSATGSVRTKNGVSDMVAGMCAKEDVTMDDILTLHPGWCLLHRRQIQDLMNYYRNKRVAQQHKPWKMLKYTGDNFETKMIVGWLNANICQTRPHKTRQLYLYGDAGTYKSSFLAKLLEYCYAYNIPTNEDWFGDYPVNPEPQLCYIDEFKGAKFTLQWLNQFVEGIRMSLKVKGTVPIIKTDNPPVIICSNVSIYHVYRKAIEKNPVMEGTIDARWLEIRLSDPIDMDNIVWPDSQVEEDTPVLNDDQLINKIFSCKLNTLQVY